MIIGSLILGLISYKALVEKPKNDIEPSINTIQERPAKNNEKVEDSVDKEKRDKEIIKAKINSWNHANEYKNANILSQLYAEKIEDFYGSKNVTKEYCITDQVKYFAQNPDSHQSVIGDIDFVKIDDSNYICYFNKEVIKNEDTETYRGILKFQKKLGDFKIIGETTMKPE